MMQNNFHLYYNIFFQKMTFVSWLWTLDNLLCHWNPSVFKLKLLKIVHWTRIESKRQQTNMSSRELWSNQNPGLFKPEKSRAMNWECNKDVDLKLSSAPSFGVWKWTGHHFCGKNKNILYEINFIQKVGLNCVLKNQSSKSQKESNIKIDWLSLTFPYR